MMGWSLDQINAKTYYVRATTENGRKVQLRWIFNDLVGMDKRGNLELPLHGKGQVIQYLHSQHISLLTRCVLEVS